MESPQVALFVSRGILAAVLAAAGVAKLITVRGTRTSLHVLGAPSSVASVVAVLLPVVELCVAAALLTRSYSRPGLIATLGLMLGSTAVLTYGMSTGRAAGCRCFASLSGDTTPLLAIFRALTLAALAGIVLWQSGAQHEMAVYAWTLSLSPVRRLGLAAGIAVVVTVIAGLDVGRFLALGWSYIWRSVRAPRATGSPIHPIGPATRIAPIAGVEPAGLPVGRIAPSRNGGAGMTFGVIASSVVTLVVFTRNEATHCRRAVATLSAWRVTRQVPIALEAVDVDLPHGRALAREYRVRAVPAVVLVNADGSIGSRVSVGGGAIEALLRALEQGGFTGDAAALAQVERREHPLTAVTAVSGAARCAPCGK